MKYFDDAMLEKITLEKTYIQVAEKFSSYWVENVRFDAMPRISDDLVYSLTVVVASHAIEKTPTSWWQHFKKDYFPGWALRRWPIRYIKTQVVVNCEPRHFVSSGVANIEMFCSGPFVKEVVIP